jgi:hypothetical protein
MQGILARGVAFVRDIWISNVMVVKQPLQVSSKSIYIYIILFIFYDIHDLILLFGNDWHPVKIFYWVWKYYAFHNDLRHVYMHDLIWKKSFVLVNLVRTNNTSENYISRPLKNQILIIGKIVIHHCCEVYIFPNLFSYNYKFQFVFIYLFK